MSRGLIAKTARDALVLFLLVAAGILIFEALLVLVFGALSEQVLDIWARIPFVQRLLKALIGVDVTGEVTLASLLSLGLVHPILFALLWSFEVTMCTRVILGEIESGTADLLLALPMSRARVYASVSVVWIAAGALLCCMIWVGLALGTLLFATPEPVPLARFGKPLLNLFALYVAIGCGTMCVSVFCVRRGPAIAMVLAVLLASLLVEFVAAFVPSLERMRFVGLLAYYDPAEIVRSGRLPPLDLAVLAIGAASAWALGLWRFNTRDIPAA